MKVKAAQLLEYLKKNELTVEDFAKKLHFSVGEVEKMLAGKAVGINTARKFISYFSAEQAQALIDWEAIGKKNPLAEDCPNTDKSKDDCYKDSFDKDDDL